MRKQFVLLLSLLCVCCYVKAETFTIGYTPDQLLLVPNSIPRVKCAFEYAGHNVVFKRLPMERSLRMAERGKIDGDLARIAAVPESSDGLIKIPLPIGEIEVWVFGRVGLSIFSVEDLKRLRLVKILGFRYFDRFSSPSYPYIVRANSAFNAYHMLYADRGDYTFGTLLAQRKIDMYGVSSHIKRYFDFPIDRQKMFTVLNKKHEGYIAELNQAFEIVFAGNNCPA